VRGFGRVNSQPVEKVNPECDRGKAWEGKWTEKSSDHETDSNKKGLKKRNPTTQEANQEDLIKNEKLT